MSIALLNLRDLYRAYIGKMGDMRTATAHIKSDGVRRQVDILVFIQNRFRNVVAMFTYLATWYAPYSNFTALAYVTGQLGFDACDKFRSFVGSKFTVVVHKTHMWIVGAFA